MRSRRKQVGFIAFAAVVIGLLVDGTSAAYTFTKIADTTTTPPLGAFSQFGVPAISGDTVAFEGDYSLFPNAFAGKGIFTGNGGPLTTIATLGSSVPGGIVKS